MREALGCVLLWGCLPTIDLALPEVDLEPKTWVLIGERYGEQVAEVFEPGQIDLQMDAAVPMTAIAYALPPSELQLRVGPLELTSSGRTLPTDARIARVFLSDPAPEGRREWHDGEAEHFIAELDPDRCFDQQLCRPDSEAFAWCEASCGPGELAAPMAPMPTSTVRPVRATCGAGTYQFDRGCARVGAECPAGWPADLPPDAILVETFAALSEAVATATAGSTIAIRGNLSNELPVVVERPLTIRGACADNAAISTLIVASGTVALDSLYLDSLQVSEGGAASIARSDARVYADGNVRISDSRLRELTARRLTVISGSVLTGSSSARGATIDISDTVLVDAPLSLTMCKTQLTRVATLASKVVAIGGGHLYLEKLAQDGIGGTSVVDMELTITDSAVGPTEILQSTAAITQSSLRSDQISAALYVTASELRLTDVEISSKENGAALHDTNTHMMRVRIDAELRALLHRIVLLPTVTLDGEDLDASGLDGFELESRTMLRRVRVRASSRGIDLYESTDAIEIGQLQIESQSIGLQAAPVARTAIEDFEIVADGIGVEVPPISGGPTVFRRGTIDARIPFQYDGTSPDDFFIQTRFEIGR